MPSSSEAPATKGKAPHRRSETARQAVLQAADDLLVERGFAGVTIEGIAARAGVAKQTIYRWWPSKAEILFDTLEDDSSEPLAIAETESALEDIRLHLRSLARFLAKDPAGRVLLALIGQAQHDSGMRREFRTRYMDGRRREMRAALKRAVAAGEVSADLRPDDAIDALYGPIFFRAMVTDSATPASFTDTLVTQVLG